MAIQKITHSTQAQKLQKWSSFTPANIWGTNQHTWLAPQPLSSTIPKCTYILPRHLGDVCHCGFPSHRSSAVKTLSPIRMGCWPNKRIWIVSPMHICFINLAHCPTSMWSHNYTAGPTHSSSRSHIQNMMVDWSLPYHGIDIPTSLQHEWQTDKITLLPLHSLCQAVCICQFNILHVGELFTPKTLPWHLKWPHTHQSHERQIFQPPKYH